MAVPGELRGLEELHRKYGRLSWAQVVQPSVRLAREGVPVGYDLNFVSRPGCRAEQQGIVRDCTPPGSTQLEGSWFELSPPHHSLFSNGEALVIGSKWERREYADLLERIAKEGADCFYKGDVAEATARCVQRAGGLMTLDDLKGALLWLNGIRLMIAYKPVWRKALTTPYRDYQLWAPPAPASGAIWLSAMGTLSHFKPDVSGSTLDTHHLIEALRVSQHRLGP